MTPEQIELTKDAARLILAHRDAGRTCDPHSVQWAEQLLGTNKTPAAAVAEPDPFDGGHA